MIDGKIFFYKPVKKNNNDKIRTYENTRNIETGQEDGYITGVVLDYYEFKNCHKMIAIELSKQQTQDADPKAILQIKFTANID